MNIDKTQQYIQLNTGVKGIQQLKPIINVISTGACVLTLKAGKYEQEYHNHTLQTNQRHHEEEHNVFGKVNIQTKN